MELLTFGSIKKKLAKECDVATIVFDGGKAWGIKMQKTYSKNIWFNAVGRVFNGEAWITADTGESGATKLTQDLEFFHDWWGEDGNPADEGYLYLCSSVNPAKRFKSIEIVDRGAGIVSASENSKAKDVTIENLEVFGAGAHGIGFGGVENVKISYCTFKWIGGSIQQPGVPLFETDDFGVRFGNAIESSGDTNGFTIDHCYASQIYDSCWSVQSTAAITIKDFTVSNNVSEFATAGLEVWNNEADYGGVLTKGTVTNLNVHDNHTRYSGYGWGHQRSPKNAGYFMSGGVSTDNSYTNCKIHDNINYVASYSALYMGATGKEQYNLYNNIYILGKDKYLGYLCENPGTGTGALSWHGFNKSNILTYMDEGFEIGSKFFYISSSKTSFYEKANDIIPDMKQN